MNEKTSAIELGNVSRTFPRPDGDVHALVDLSLHVDVGETIAVTGASGSGKSTMLSLIAGLDQPTSGTIHVFGWELTGMSEDERADLRRREMGFVFQNYHLIPTLTICENVMLPLIPEEGNTLELRAKALARIEEVGLERRIGHLPGELSGGEQQRVSLARALIGEPSLILADEPTGNLDEGSAGTILDLLFQLAEHRGRTLVLTTHNEAVAARCRRRLRLHEGREQTSG